MVHRLLRAAFKRDYLIPTSRKNALKLPTSCPTDSEALSAPPAHLSCGWHPQEPEYLPGSSGTHPRRTSISKRCPHPGTVARGLFVSRLLVVDFNAMVKQRLFPLPFICTSISGHWQPSFGLPLLSGGLLLLPGGAPPFSFGEGFPVFAGPSSLPSLDLLKGCRQIEAEGMAPRGLTSLPT